MQKQKAQLKGNGQLAKDKQFIAWREKQAAEHAASGGSETFLQPTAAYSVAKITPQQLYIAQEQRSKMGAHGRVVASGGRDLMVGGRAVAQWTKGARHSMA